MKFTVRLPVRTGGEGFLTHLRKQGGLTGLYIHTYLPTSYIHTYIDIHTQIQMYTPPYSIFVYRLDQYWAGLWLHIIVLEPKFSSVRRMCAVKLLGGSGGLPVFGWTIRSFRI
mmetsp:Transcript_13282/g.21802  ORF Transcript_13282/g.21802 Transcript_13282/m.21802 type:complete len:113 (+) Transcript_13282:1636-1974(+)